jgi:glycosyltransferase involved in cell wall biosynthesis
MLSPRLKAYLRPLYRELQMVLTPRKQELAPPERTFKERAQELIRLSKEYGPEWEVTHEMLSTWRPHAAWLGRQLQEHAVTVGYVFAPIYAMIHGNTPCVAVEIGTMRDIPFDGTSNGKLLSLAYRLADEVVITNPDVIQAARRLGLERYRFCPHPVDETIFCPPQGEPPLRRELQGRSGCNFLLFAPARQNWEIKGNDRYLRAFAELGRRGVKATLIIPAWGTEIDRSKKLCQELGIAERVAWVAPMCERVMVKYYQAVDAVLDQFQLGVFGLITCKAMACGQTVITSYDDPIHRWCFAEPPPLMPGRNESEILEAMLALHADRGKGKAMGVAARTWIERHHSAKVVCTILEAAMCDAIEHFGSRQTKAA